MTESAAPRCLKLISAPQGPNRGESLRGGMKRERILSSGVGGFMGGSWHHFSHFFAIFSIF